MAEVYWIRSIHHTDVFSEGYIGVTTKGSLIRYKQHIVSAMSSRAKKSIIHKVIKSRGPENIVLEVVCICEETYAYELENKLRPTEFIGWNQNVGGIKPPSSKGKIRSAETRAKMSKAFSGIQSQAKRSASLKNSPFISGCLRSEESKHKHRETLQKNGPWNNPAADRDFWVNAAIFYEDFAKGLTIMQLMEKHELTRNKLKTIFKHFKKGWVPAEDTKWVEDFEEKITSVKK